MLREELFTNYPSCIYVCLDEEKVYMESSQHFELPYFDNFEKSLFAHYSKLNHSSSHQIVQLGKKTAKPSTTNKKKELKYFTDDDEKMACINILEVFKTTLQDKIIKHIPADPIFKDKVSFSFKKLS